MKLDQDHPGAAQDSISLKNQKSDAFMQPTHYFTDLTKVCTNVFIVLMMTDARCGYNIPLVSGWIYHVTVVFICTMGH